MAQFYDLPRELRDLIYMAILNWECPRPTLEQTFGWPNTWNLRSGHRGDDGCVFSMKKVPPTCANVLVVNRQVNEELMQAISRARRTESLLAKLDCIARNGETFYFTWLSIPTVHTTTVSAHEANHRSVSTWGPNVPVLGKLLAASPRSDSSRTKVSTHIERLHIDVRIFDNDLAKQTRLRSPPIQTSWAICAALQKILEQDPDSDSSYSSPGGVDIETLVLNIIPPSIPKDLPTNLEESARIEAANLPQTVARELVDVWNKLWSGDSYKARQYRVLLEKIMKVRICVDGVMIRERELRLELERGQAERRRIAMRVGW
ncbi:hypothetical protein EK21DRAFT_54741 [Setomelanomma holmii]|uniref:Uncharacterized protein n=1 Tax=Setomelanomma holmii TaxID=210430 RepID=A0A9P4HJC2_9PLEO|nr:hypothetical protein EK21DRAFT_54741 [Setomelanomma holmii]